MPGTYLEHRSSRERDNAPPCLNIPGLDDSGGFALLPPIFLGNIQLRHIHFVNPVAVPEIARKTPTSQKHWVWNERVLAMF